MPRSRTERCSGTSVGRSGSTIGTKFKGCTGRFFEARRYCTGLTSSVRINDFADLKQFAMPEGISAGVVWARATPSKVVLPTTFKNLPTGYCQSGITTYLVALSNTVVTNMTSNNAYKGVIYVPDELVADYQTTYSGLSSKIRPLSDFDTDYPDDAKWI